jgi:hypothetical protein
MSLAPKTIGLRLVLGFALLLMAHAGYAQETPEEPVKPLTPATAPAPLPPPNSVKTATPASSSAAMSSAAPPPAVNAPGSTSAPAAPGAPSKAAQAGMGTVTIPAGTRIAVVLDVPVSTRISHKGQAIRFRTTESLMVDGRMELPSDSTFGGKLLDVKKPARFGIEGNIVLAVDTLELADGSHAPITAKLQATDPQASGKPGDHSKSATILSSALWTAQGTLLGLAIGGAHGAAIGAGAGGAIAVGILASKRGHDVYLEPGTPFLVNLDQPVTFQALRPATPAPSVEASSQAEAGSTDAASTDGSTSGDPDRPKLKVRPKPAGQAANAPPATPPAPAPEPSATPVTSAPATPPPPPSTPPQTQPPAPAQQTISPMPPAQSSSAPSTSPSSPQ